MPTAGRAKKTSKHAAQTEDSRTRRQRVVDSIQSLILNGKLKPGEPLRQVALSQQHGVSQTVIRESLQVLEQHGLVTGAGKQGFVVREFGASELMDAYRVREVLEGLAARLCCRKVSRDDVDGLRDLAEQIYASSRKKDRAKRSDLEYTFHQCFLTISGNDTLERICVGYRFVGNLAATERDPDELLQEHLAIVEAVANNRPDEAEQLARLHVARTAGSILESNGK